MKVQHNFGKAESMVMTSTEPILIPETVLILRDRMKHGQNVAKILESQVDTAQQNIVLLQGQVRLANETISNLKKHFQETEKILTKLFEPEPQVRTFEPEIKDGAKETPVKIPEHSVSTTSPILHDSGTESNKSFGDKSDANKSPYAQQLRQVLDVLQDEEPRKTACVPRSEAEGSKDCACTDCQPHHCNCGSSNCTGEHYTKRDDFCKAKHKINGHASSHEVSPKSLPHTVQTSYPNHCAGPCCSSTEPATFKVVEKTTAPVHYISVHSPAHVGDKHSERHPGHCGDKCQCHAFVNYVPYGYHLVESAPGIPESIQPISPSARRKRSYVPVIPGEEPPHLKYTKVKRIDGSKLTAQKMLQDFTKRRFCAYNPRYDLDLLIVPPPIPAFDLIKDGKNVIKSQKMEGYLPPPEQQPLQPTQPPLPQPPPPQQQNSSTVGETNVTPAINGIDTLDRHPTPANFEMNNVTEQNTTSLNSSNGTDILNATPCSNGSNGYNDSNNNTIPTTSVNNINDSVNNNNDNNTNNSFVHSLFKSPTNNVKLLPVIKEENVEGRKKLENHIALMRAEPIRNSPTLNQDISYSLSLKQERTMSPITVGSSRT